MAESLRANSALRSRWSTYHEHTSVQNVTQSAEVPDKHPGKTKDMCALLRKHTYGARKAVGGWHCEYSSTLVEDMGFTIGGASSCVF